MKYLAQSFKYGPSLRGPCVKNEGLVFHGMAPAIRLINSLLYGKKKYIPNIHQEFADKFPKNYFSQIKTKIIFPRFSLIFKFSENCP